jgi:hypothetical protein
VEDDRLRELLELWQREAGALSLEQMLELADWPETPELTRQQLTTAIEQRRSQSTSLFARLRASAWRKR